MTSNMTPDQVRDEVARIDGSWTKKGDRWYHAIWHKNGSGQKRHPCPESLDAVAALWKQHAEGWTWRRDWMEHPDFTRRDEGLVLVWQAIGPEVVVHIPDTGDEIADRYAMLLKVLKHKSGQGAQE